MREYRSDDYHEIWNWCEDRGLPFPEKEDLPFTGKIIPGVAAGFLIATDTSTAIIDFMITNPKASVIDRGKSITHLVNGLLEVASELGFKRVKCDSQIDTIKKKAKSLGFLSLGSYEVFSREI